MGIFNCFKKKFQNDNPKKISNIEHEATEIAKEEYSSFKYIAQNVTLDYMVIDNYCQCYNIPLENKLFFASVWMLIRNTSIPTLSPSYAALDGVKFSREYCQKDANFTIENYLLNLVVYLEVAIYTTDDDLTKDMTIDDIIKVIAYKKPYVLDVIKTTLSCDRHSELYRKNERRWKPLITKSVIDLLLNYDVETLADIFEEAILQKNMPNIQVED